MMDVMRGGLGIAFFILVAWLMSADRKRFPVRLVVAGLIMQLVLAVAVLKWTPGQLIIKDIADLVARMLEVAVKPAAATIFGPVISAGDSESSVGFVFAMAGTGLIGIIFFSALLAVLYHLRIMQLVVWALAFFMSKALRVSGAESLAMAANVFVGQTEAPLVIRPYLDKLTRSEVMALMTGGFATVAGTVLAIYIGITSNLGLDLAPHFIAASVMSAPAAFLIAKILQPETETSKTGGALSFSEVMNAGRPSRNLVEAAATGTQDGLKLYLNVVAMLLSFLALVHLVDWPLGALGVWMETHWSFGPGETLSTRYLLGLVFSPVAWLMGANSWNDCQLMGQLMGTKLTLTEFVAIFDFSQMKVGPELVVETVPPLDLSDLTDTTGLLVDTAIPIANETVSGNSPVEDETQRFDEARSAKMAVYALCGFANIGSIGIQIGGLSALAPERRSEFAALAMKAMIGGAMASWMTATVAGMFI